MVMILDELLIKGYLFTVTSNRGIEYDGTVIMTIPLLVTKKIKNEAIHRVIYRRMHIIHQT